MYHRSRSCKCNSNSKNSVLQIAASLPAYLNYTKITKYERKNAVSKQKIIQVVNLKYSFADRIAPLYEECSDHSLAEKSGNKVIGRERGTPVEPSPRIPEWSKEPRRTSL